MKTPNFYQEWDLGSVTITVTHTHILIKEMEDTTLSLPLSLLAALQAGQPGQERVQHCISVLPPVSLCKCAQGQTAVPR